MPTHVISANGTPADETTGDVQVPIFKRKVILNDAQIKALPSAGVELVPPAGAGKAYIVHAVTLSLKWNANYSNIHASAATFISSWNTGSEYCERLIGNSILQNLLAYNESTFITNVMGIFQYTLADADNSEVSLFINNNGNGNFTGGHADNTLEVTAFYSIIDL